MIKGHFITAIDLGTSAIKLLTVSKKKNGDNLEVLTSLQGPSSGLRKGTVINPEEVSKSLVAVLKESENLIAQKTNFSYFNIGGSHLSLIPSRGGVVVSRADQKISQEDVERVVQNAQSFSLPPNSEILETFLKEFTVDKETGIKEPLGMAGVRLEADVLCLCGFTPYLKNLTSAILGSGLQVEDLITSVLAVSRSVLTKKQKELGAAVLDIGAGTSDLAVFEEGALIHLAVFPIGSANITNDIAIGLKTDIDVAERIKREFGGLILPGRSKSKKVKIETPDSQEPLIFSTKQIAEIIGARVGEIFDLVNKELKQINRQELLPAGIVLTGGGAKLPRLVEFAKKELKLPAHIGIAKEISGLEEDSSWSLVAGLVLSAAEIEGTKKSFDFSKGVISKLKGIFRIFIP